MKIPKLALVIGAVVLVLAVALVFHFYMKARVDAAVALARADAQQAQIAQLDQQLEDSHAIITEIEGSLEAAREEARARDAAFIAAIEKIKTAAPPQLVSQGGQVIGATDIVLSADQQTVTMGVETYRKFVLAATEAQEYKTVKEPAWNAREALYIKDIAQYKQNEISYQQKDVLNAGIISDLRSVVSHQKTTSIFEKIVWTAAGFGAGVLADKLVK